MNKSPLIDSAKKLFSQLYAIDVDELDKETKLAHKDALNAAYTTLLELENTELKAVLDANDSALAEINAATEQLLGQIIQEQKLTKKIQLAARGLEALQKVLKV